MIDMMLDKGCSTVSRVEPEKYLLRKYCLKCDKQKTIYSHVSFTIFCNAGKKFTNLIDCMYILLS